MSPDGSGEKAESEGGIDASFRGWMNFVSRNMLAEDTYHSMSISCISSMLYFAPGSKGGGYPFSSLPSSAQPITRTVSEVPSPQ